MTPEINYETPEQNHETPEMNYVTPETNFEKSESVQISGELQNNTETINEGSIYVPTVSPQSTTAMNPPKGETNKNKPTVESVVQEVYSLVQTTVNSSGTDPSEKSENVAEEDEEIR